ncbi:sulfurtransferase TusA family protein [Hydromonas duriensis]|uniref:tRNA 2-thiouridine synthesizing protein A n=1 Tax=Hydromonas duriensis TaxID=1527608 RepID=A0A4R6Y8U0_9BURK|nr:sulfurtransferase TusA family protein [Hydromonas duriensis]TDR31833.1 tRNA 2-thiouridine synthesizing protein A [Hydromonas duriensis]
MQVLDELALAELDKMVAHTEDVCGLNCPLPILRTKKALAKMSGGQLLKVLTTDKAAVTDLAQFAKQTGHVLKAQVQKNEYMVHYIVRRIDE